MHGLILGLLPLNISRTVYLKRDGLINADLFGVHLIKVNIRRRVSVVPATDDALL